MIPHLRVEIEGAAAQALARTAARQLPYAAALALNDVANQFQATEQLLLKRRFLIRRPWVLQGIKIENADRATKTKLEVTLRVDPTRGFLIKFEEGGVKVSRTGGSLALPETRGPNAGFTKDQVITKAKRPKSYQFQSHVTRAGKVQIQGAHRTFIVQTSHGRGILQRQGHGAGSRLVRLFWLAPRANIKPVLDFIATAEDTMRAKWAESFEHFFQLAMQTAR